MGRVRAGSAPGPARVLPGSGPGPARVLPGSSPNPAQFSPRSALLPAQMLKAGVFAHVLRLLHMLAHPCGPVNTSLRCARVPEKSTISQRAWGKVAEGALLPLALSSRNGAKKAVEVVCPIIFAFDAPMLSLLLVLLLLSL